MPDGLRNNIYHLLNVIRGGSGNKGSPCPPGQLHNVKTLGKRSRGRRCRSLAGRGHGGELTACHPIDAVIHDNGGEINISVGRMNKSNYAERY